MNYIYNTDATRNEYEVVYLDNNDNKVFAYVKAYSEKQAEFYVKKKKLDCYRILRVTKLREIPDPQGKQIMMDLGDFK